MMARTTMVAALIACVALAGCADSKVGPQVEFKTSLGDFVVETWPGAAPITVQNFLQYVVDEHYDGLTFHRIAPNFVVQGGGFLPDHETLRPTRAPIVNEATASNPNLQWTLSMARTNSPDSATSQFFVNLKDNANLDKTASSAGYAVFGEVISGFETIEAMTQVAPGESFSAGGFIPKEPIVIESARIIKGDGPSPSPPPTPASLSANTITAGATTVTATTDRVMVWARNAGQAGATVAWQLTGPEGAPLPDGWAATFSAPSQAIGGHRTSTEAVHTILELNVPSGASGTHALELHTGLSTTEIAVTVALDGKRVSDAGDAVNVNYRGTCVADGSEFDAGQFPLTLGGGRAIAGFDWGLVGLQEAEEVTITIPAALAYGHDGGPCGGLMPADLDFDVSIDSFDN